MERMKALQIYGLFIIVALVSLLFVYAYRFKKYEKYYDLESKIVESVKTLPDYKDKAKDKLFTSVTIPQNELSEIKLIVDDDNCVAYAKLDKYAFVYSYKAYLKCNNYRTIGYSKKS